MKLPQVNFPATTRKSSANYLPLHAINKSDVSKILDARKRFSIDRAQHRILHMPCLEEFVSSSKTAGLSSTWFGTQLRSYLQIYSPKCPFRIATSENLSGRGPEAAVFANRAFKIGEIIPLLGGVCVPLTRKDRLRLEESGKDFSILQSSCGRFLAMLLGPARFVNHDCMQNCEIVWPGESEAIVVALKDIHADDEITVYYGSDYFGANNQECLCRPCTTDGTVSSGCPDETDMPVIMIKLEARNKKNAERKEK
ncbi:unnamed protein product [Penicillium olsonii]|uniref:SET domain-containing protein n=1 Tax=Penicillium olsonii TaxID=99116 RepID=A0A9W4I820_PENOL|nr:unnamed protein product [Penicillium olsonii]